MPDRRNGIDLRESGIDPSSAEVVRICWIVEIHEGWSAIVCGIEVSEAARAKGRSRGSCAFGAGGAETLHVAVQEEEGVILPEGATDGGTEVITNVWILGTILLCIEEISRTEGVISAKLVGFAVKAIGSASGDYIDNGTGISSVFSVEVIRNNAKFLR